MQIVYSAIVAVFRRSRPEIWEAFATNLEPTNVESEPINLYHLVPC